MKLLVYLFLLVILSGCFDKGIITQNGYYFSNKTHFKIKDKCVNNDTAIIQLNSQYILKCDAGNEGRSGFEFFANGRVASFEWFKTPDSIPRVAKAAGFFCLDKNEIVIELSYSVPMGWTGSQFLPILLKGKIASDTILFTEDKIKGRGKNKGLFTPTTVYGKQCGYYIRKSRCVYLDKPDW